MVLTDHLYQSEFDKIKVQAAFFGVDLEKEVEKVTPKTNTEKVFTFRDPKEYEHLSKEERLELTEKMMGQHKNWAHQRKEIGAEDEIRA